MLILLDGLSDVCGAASRFDPLPLDFVNLKRNMILSGDFKWVSDVSKGYMGQVTDRDVELVDLLIENPSLSLEELGERLGITKQAVAERRKRLEEEGFSKSFYFWNITPRFECTKRIRLRVDGGTEKIDDIVRVLDGFNPVVVFFKTIPDDFFEGKRGSLTETIDEVEGVLHFNNEGEEEKLRQQLERLGITELSMESILFSRLLGERCDLKLTPPENIEEIAREITQRLSSNASVQAVLYEQTDQPTDQFDLLIIRDERFQPETDSYERRENQVLVDYHFTNLRWFMDSTEGWLKDMKLLYAQDEPMRRRLQRKIDSLKN